MAHDPQGFLRHARTDTPKRPAAERVRDWQPIYLRAKPEEHYKRVVAQGDTRPMNNRPTAMAELRGLLATRAPLYGEADATIDTSSRAVSDSFDALLKRQRTRELALGRSRLSALQLGKALPCELARGRAIRCLRGRLRGGRARGARYQHEQPRVGNAPDLIRNQ